jgi:hypothetical protein
LIDSTSSAGLLWAIDSAAPESASISYPFDIDLDKIDPGRLERIDADRPPGPWREFGSSGAFRVEWEKC